MIPAMLLLLAGMTVMASCSHQKEKEMALAAQREQARRDSIDALNRQAYDEFVKDSTQRAQLYTRSLALFELRGPIKSVTFSEGPAILPASNVYDSPVPKTYTFDEQGNWTNYQALFACLKVKARGGVPSNGYVPINEQAELDDCAESVEIKWSNDKVRSVEGHGYEWEYEYKCRYEEAFPQNLMSESGTSSGEGYTHNYSTIYNVTERDAYGNWLERKANTTSIGGYYDEPSTKETTHKTESRTIEYWPIQAPTRIPY